MLHLPLRYEDETRLDALADASDGATIQVEAIVVDHAVQYRPRRQLVVRVEEVDTRARLSLRFIHFYGSQLKHFEPGARLRIRGELRGGLQLNKGDLSLGIAAAGSTDRDLTDRSALATIGLVF